MHRSSFLVDPHGVTHNETTGGGGGDGARQMRECALEVKSSELNQPIQSPFRARSRLQRGRKPLVLLLNELDMRVGRQAVESVARGSVVEDNVFDRLWSCASTERTQSSMKRPWLYNG